MVEQVMGRESDTMPPANTAAPDAPEPNETALNDAGSVEVTPVVGWSWLVEGIRPYLGWILIAAGLLSIFLGWYGASGQSLVAKQIPYLASEGVLGIVLIAMGNRVFMVNDLRRDSGRLDRLEQMVAELHAVLLTRADAQPVAPAASGRPTAKPFRAVRKGTSYHVPDCAMVAGKDAISLSRAEVVSSSLRPCRMCSPDPV
jgi:hypothetical protein